MQRGKRFYIFQNACSENTGLHVEYGLFCARKTSCIKCSKKIRCRVAIVGTIQYYDTKYGKKMLYLKKEERGIKNVIFYWRREEAARPMCQKIGNWGTENMSNNITMLYTTYTCKIWRLVRV